MKFYYLKSKNVPEEWKHSLIIKVPKKEDLLDCNNWRGITLQSIAGEDFHKMLLCKMRDKNDILLREEQAGFHPCRS